MQLAYTHHNHHVWEKKRQRDMKTDRPGCSDGGIVIWCKSTTDPDLRGWEKGGPLACPPYDGSTVKRKISPATTAWAMIRTAILCRLFGRNKEEGFFSQRFGKKMFSYSQTKKCYISWTPLRWNFDCEMKLNFKLFFLLLKSVLWTSSSKSNSSFLWWKFK